MHHSSVHVASLQQQVNELGNYKKLTKVQESQERLIQCLKEKHQKEMLELKGKVVQTSEELDRTQGQLKFLEQYFQQTIPERMEVINRLSRNLESVQNNCQRLLGTDVMRDVEKLTLQQSEKEKLECLNNAKIQNLMEALGELGNKITNVEKMETIPLSVHSKLLSENEMEKNELETRLKNVNTELMGVKENNNKLIVENSKMKNEMEAIIKKHDVLMKSAIEKYHNLHKNEMAKSRKELLEKFEEEKSNLCSFYEEKITTIQSEMKRLMDSLDEVKEMYIKVCEERNEFEGQLQKVNSEEAKDLVPKEELDRRINEAKRLWEEAATKKHTNELSKVRENWERFHVSIVKQATKIIAEMFRHSSELFSKEREKMCERLVALQTKLATLQENFLNLKIPKWEDREKGLHARFVQEQNNLLVHTRDDLNRQWQEKLMEVERLYRGKLTEIQVAQQKELDNIMVEVQKAMAEEKGHLLSRHREIISHLKTEIARLNDQLLLIRQTDKSSKKDAAVSCALNNNERDAQLYEELSSTKKELAEQAKKGHKEREAFLTQYHSVLNSLQQSQDREEQLRKLSNVCKKCKGPVTERNSRSKKSNVSNGSNGSGHCLVKISNRHVYVQTEEKMVSRDRVRELMKAYADILRELTEEVMQQLSTSSLQQAERLRLFILDYFKTAESNRKR